MPRIISLKQAMDKLFYDNKKNKADISKVNQQLSTFAFKKENGKKYVSTDNGATWENFSSGAELLWTNPAPTNAFPAQTVKLDLTDYEYVVIETKYITTEDYLPNPKIIIPNPCNTLINVSTATGSMDWNTQHRYITKIDDNGITFSNGYSSSTAINERCIPLKIYGLKDNIFNE